MYDDNKQLI